MGSASNPGFTSTSSLFLRDYMARSIPERESAWPPAIESRNAMEGASGSNRKSEKDRHFSSACLSRLKAAVKRHSILALRVLSKAVAPNGKKNHHRRRQSGRRQD